MLFDLQTALEDVDRLREKAAALPVRLQRARSDDELWRIDRDARAVVGAVPHVSVRLAMAVRAHELTVQMAQAQVGAVLAAKLNDAGSARKARAEVARAKARLAKLARQRPPTLPAPAPLKQTQLGDLWSSIQSTVSSTVAAATNAANTVAASASSVVQKVTGGAPTQSGQPDAWEQWCDNGGAAKSYGGDLKMCKIGARGQGAFVAGLAPWTAGGIQARFALNMGVPSPAEYDPEKLWVTAQTDPVRAAWLLAYATAVSFPISGGVLGAAYVGTFLNTPVSPMGAVAFFNVVLPLTAIRAAQAKENFFDRVMRVLLAPVLGDMLNQVMALMKGGFTPATAIGVYIDKEINRQPPYSPEMKAFLQFIKDNLGKFAKIAGVGDGKAPADLQHPQIPSQQPPPPPQTGVPPGAPRPVGSTAPKQVAPPQQQAPSNGPGILGPAAAVGVVGAAVGGPVGAVIGGAVGALVGSILKR